MVMKVVSVKLIKDTDKFVFFSVTYIRERFLFSSEVTDECFVHKFTDDGLKSSIYEYGKNERWWKSPDAWLSVSTWLYRNEVDELKGYVKV
jgi:hypothetical protein